MAKIVTLGEIPISIKIFYYGKNCYTWRNYVEIIHSG